MYCMHKHCYFCKANASTHDLQDLDLSLMTVQLSLLRTTRLAGHPKAALLFWFFGDFRCVVSLFIVIRVIYKYRNR